MNKTTFIAAIALLLVFMPAAVFADDESGNVVVSEETETEGISEDYESSENADVDGLVDEDTDESVCDDIYSEEAAPSPETEKSAPDNRYTEATFRISRAISEGRDYIDLSDLNAEESSLEKAIIEEHVISSSIESFSLLVEEPDMVIAMTLTYLNQDSTEDPEDSSCGKEKKEIRCLDEPSSSFEKEDCEYTSPSEESIVADTPDLADEDGRAEDKSASFLLLTIILTAIGKLLGGVI